MQFQLRTLMITSEWPTAEKPDWVPFLVQQVEFLRRAGVDVEVFPFRGAKRLSNYWKARRDVQTKLRCHQYDLIHAQFGQSALLALPSTRCPLVVTFRGSDVRGFVGEKGRYTVAGKILQKISVLAAYQADEVILVSEGLKSYLPQRQYHIIPSGLNLDRFQPMDQLRARHELGFAEDEILVLFGGRPTVPEKRFSLAQAAIELLQRQFPAARLVVLQGEPHHKIPLYMNACDALLLVSFHEGSPSVVKEALACNLPVVSTDVGDVRERIARIDGCVICESSCPDAIAAALAQVMVRRQRINGRSSVLQLDERIMAQKVIQVYQQAIMKSKSCDH